MDGYLATFCSILVLGSNELDLYNVQMNEWIELKNINNLDVNNLVKDSFIVVHREA